MSGTSISAAGSWLHYMALSKGIEKQRSQAIWYRRGIVKGVRKGGKQLESKLFSKGLTPLMYIIVVLVNKGNL